MKPCKHIEANSACRVCWLYDHDPRYRAQWGGGETIPCASSFQEQRRQAILEIKRRAQAPCRYLGEVMQPTAACGCGPLHQCIIHGQCVRAGNNNQWKSCSTCNDYKT